MTEGEKSITDYNRETKEERSLRQAQFEKREEVLRQESRNDKFYGSGSDALDNEHEREKMRIREKALHWSNTDRHWWWSKKKRNYEAKLLKLEKLRTLDEPQYYYQKHLLNWSIEGQERKAKQVFDELDCAYLIANCKTEDEYLQLKRENTNVVAFLTKNKLPVNRELFLTKADTCRNAIDEYARTIEQMEQNTLKYDFEETLLSDFKNNKALIEVELAKRTNVLGAKYHRSRVVRRENVDTLKTLTVKLINTLHHDIDRHYIIVAIHKFHCLKEVSWQHLSLKWNDNAGIHSSDNEDYYRDSKVDYLNEHLDGGREFLTYNVIQNSAIQNLNALDEDEPQQMIAY